MEETRTQIAWPSKLKIGAKSKKGESLVGASVCLIKHLLHCLMYLHILISFRVPTGDGWTALYCTVHPR